MKTSSDQKLAEKKCRPCAEGAQALSLAQAKGYIAQLSGWALADDAKAISCLYVMKDFLAAVRFIDKIAEVAESEDHHPDLHLTGYRKLRIELSTHSIGGLSENDFILAAKIDQLPKALKK
ncbi:MAG: 4a-hydroxytetrahydrobiopterin dehydratase [Candidatus Omnitrophica bacterium]|nr:4a-hydroxytetrahydrobiopterin dehydratase [Candidatus Omnitrophota bacterium]